ncbi:maleylpyruvate isomerase N-terminal domain-containing protein [Kocuria sp. LUK]|uniref:maleylpyruvate isomerase N-terminal domain-containing protein n=1 Tax=Kocuria TaxID=57493 RepID=UPI0015E00568|nr:MULTISPECIES: maleylpyruvate isomerase N-terminal domain-containing protein [Kocuria]MCD1145411.1 maleylpyruvate isomerase N-terminal domain-containing protein [Kocuria sp. LUK]
MTTRSGPVRADLVRESWAAFGAALDGLGDDDSWAPTGRTGWAVRDLVHHGLEDARRALVALHTPTTARPDRDAVSWWAEREHDPVRDAEDRRADRVAAALVRDWERLRELHAATVRAAAHAAGHAGAGAAVRTAGHVLRVEDLLSTLAVATTVRHLDLIRHLDGTPGPSADGLAEVRRVLTELWGREPLEHWSDEHFARIGTGRAEPTDEERALLGERARDLPLLR